MKLYYILILTLLVGCAHPEYAPTVEDELLNTLTTAEALRFSTPELIDSVLNKVHDAIEREDSEALWSKYYLLKAYDAFENCYPEKALDYAELAVKSACSDSQIAEMIARTSLLKALVHSDYKEYDKAFYYYLKSLTYLENSSYHYEHFIALLGVVRIKDDLNQDCSYYFNKAEQLENKYHLNKGLYFQYKSRFTEKWHEKNNLWQAADAYYREHHMQDRLFASYSFSMTFYINRNSVDSVQKYVSKAEILGGGLDLPLVKEKRKSRFYFAKAWLASKVHDITMTKSMLNQSTTFAERYKQDDVLFMSYLMRSELLEKSGDFKGALKAHQYYVHHRKLYNDKTAHDKVNIINIDYEEDKNRSQVEALIQKRTINRLTIFLITLLVLLISGIVVYLYQQRALVRRSLVKQKDKNSQDKRQLVESHNTLESIKRCLEDPRKSYSSCHKDIGSLIHSAKDETLFYDTIFDNIEFRQIIFKQFPIITESEYKYIVCVYMHFDRKKTAEILNIKLESLKSKEKRLKKKLAVGTEFTLKAYLLSVLTDQAS